MIKFLLLGVVLWFITRIFKGYIKNIGQNNDEINTQKNQSQETQQSEVMVKCDYCGVHLPKSESLISKGQYYCSEEHITASQTS